MRVRLGIPTFCHCTFMRLDFEKNLIKKGDFASDKKNNFFSANEAKFVSPQNTSEKVK